MRMLLRLVVLVALVVVIVWLVQEMRPGTAGREVRAGIDSAVRETKEAVKDLDLKLDSHQIGEELKQTGRVVRRKAVQAARKVAEVADDAKTTAAIKAKLVEDPDLSALDISVDTTDGRVTLAGRVNSPDDIGRAVRIALERDDVHEVISTLQVRQAESKKVTLVR